jgi:phenylacetate-CoA ligase
MGPTHQRALLARKIPEWLRRVPLYRASAHLADAITPDNVLAILEQLPLLAKADLRRDFPRNFLSSVRSAELAQQGSDPAGAESLEALLHSGQIELEYTSGTSEERTPLLLPAGWWAQQERSALSLNTFIATTLASEPEVRRVTLTSPVCNNEVSYAGVPTCQERTIGRTRFLSLSRQPFLWGGPELERITREIMDWQPLFLDADPVYALVLARYWERQRLRLPCLKFVLSSYEYLSVAHRRVLERVFQVPVFNIYGSTETGHLLMESDDRTFRPALETAYLETLNAPAIVADEVTRPFRAKTHKRTAGLFSRSLEGQPGRRPEVFNITELAVTTLSNDWMPLIRYQIGDLVERRVSESGECYLLHGRAAEAFRGPDGRLITVRDVDGCIGSFAAIAHYQLLERERDWLLRIVPDEEHEPSSYGRELQNQLAALVGCNPLQIVRQRTDILLSDSSGKFRLCYPRNKKGVPGGTPEP